MGAATAIVGSWAANKGAKSQESAAKDAARLNWKAFLMDRQDNRPFYSAGANALLAMSDLTGTRPTAEQLARDLNTYIAGAPGYNSARNNVSANDPVIQRFLSQPKFQMTDDPGYQFRLREGMNSLDSTAANRGGLFSGSQMRAAQEYGQQFASNEYTNTFNRLAAVAGMGQTAAQHTGGIGANAAANAGNALMTGGAAKASGYAGMANAINQGIGNTLSFGLAGIGGGLFGKR